MSTIYLHIGTMKTGTTAIQKFLAENRQILKKYGYCFPGMRYGFDQKYVHRNAHFLMYRSIKNTPEERREDVRLLQEKVYQKLEKLSFKYENIILSDEVIWQFCHLYRRFWPTLLENLERIHCSLKVIVYFRRQDLLAESLWKQGVKADRRQTETFAQWIEKKEYESVCPDYYKQLKRITRYVDRSDILVRVYEESQLLGEEHSIFSDFLDAVGLPFTEEYKRDVGGNNYGLQGNFLEMKRVINELPEYRGMENFLNQSVSAVNDYRIGREGCSPVTLFPSAEAQKEFLLLFEEGNRMVAREFLGRENGILFTEPVETLPVYDPGLSKAHRDMILFLGQALCVQEKKIEKLQSFVGELHGEAKDAAAREERISGEIRDELGRLRTEVTSMYKSSIFRAYRKVQKAVKGQ